MIETPEEKDAFDHVKMVQDLNENTEHTKELLGESTYYPNIDVKEFMKG